MSTHPLLAVMLKRWSSKGNHTVLERGEVVLAKEDGTTEVHRRREWVALPACTVVSENYPGGHAIVVMADLRRVTVLEEARS